MSNVDPKERKRLTRRLFAAFVLVVFASALGLWTGKLSVPDDVPEYQGIEGGPKRPTKAAQVKEEDLSAPTPPLYFYAGSVANDKLPVVLEEVKLAAAAGVDQVILPVSLDWESSAEAANARALLEQVVQLNPKARVFLQLKLDPTPQWAGTRPTEALKTAPDQPVYGAPYSSLWREEAARRAAALATSLSREKLGRHVRGYLLSALKDGRWELPADAGPATCGPASFKDWLQKRYTDSDTLRKAWGNPNASLEVVSFPEEPKEMPPGKAFLDLPAQQALADYREFLSDSVADSIAAVMASIKETSPELKVFALYGHTVEVTSGAQGMLGMGRLLYSDLDGFAGAIAASERGIGGTGGLAGPAFSTALHQKQWIIIDDTRTGVARDPVTGQIARMQGIRAEDVYNVQRRNFSLAAVHGLALAWTDPQGEGWLHDAEQWTEFGKMRDIYASLYPPVVPAAVPSGAQGSVAASSEEEPFVLLAKTEKKKKEPEKKSSTKDAPAKKTEVKKPDAKTKEAKQEPAPEPATETPPAALPDEKPAEPVLEPVPVGPPNTFKVGLAVVIDETAINYLANAAAIRERLTMPARDAALRSGAAFRTCLLQDVLDDIAPSAQVYLFVNAFRLSASERDRLHARLQRDQACAIWCYAPGYLAPEANADAVSKTVGMHVLPAPGTQAGSTFTLGGRWLQQGADIGEAAPFDPLFSIDDAEADVVAQYKGTQKGSIALRVLPEGWTSIYVAEPSMTPGLLRELLHLTEKHLCFRNSDREVFDTAYVGLNLVAIHAKQGGEIPLSLGYVFNIEDLFDNTIGWPQKESITLPVKTGETRLLKLTPAS